MESKALSIYNEVNSDDAFYHLSQCETDAEKAAILEDLASRTEGELLEYLHQIADLLRKAASSEVKVGVCRALANAAENSLPYSQDVASLLSDEDADVRYQACVALASMGPNAGIQQRPVESLLQDKSEAVRCAACAALGAFEVSSSASKVAALLNDASPEVQGAACYALSKMGEAGAEHAADVASKLSEPRSRLQAIYSLASMDDAGTNYCDRIVDCLGDQDEEIRLTAAQQCGEMAEAVKSSDSAWNKLSGLLGDGNGFTRCAAALALGYMGKEAADLIDSIKDMLDDDFADPGVTALTIGGGRPRIPPSSRKAKCAAAAALGLIIQDGAEVEADVYASEVANLLDDSDWENRMVALEALGMMGDKAHEQAVRVSAVFDDERYVVRAKAAYASGKLKDTEAVSGLADLIGDNCPSVREEAMLALAELGDDADEYIEKVFEKLNDFSPSVRAASMTALSRMGMKGQCYAGAIAARLMEWDAPFVLVAGLEALGNMEEHGSAYADLVAEYLEDEHPSVRAAAVASLGRMGPDAEEFADSIKSMTSDPSGEVKRAADKAVLALRI